MPRRLAGRTWHQFVYEKALELMESTTGKPPLVRRLPIERGLERLGGPPAMRVAEAGQNPPRRRTADGFDQLLAKGPKRYRVQEDGAVAGEPQDAALWLEIEQLTQIQIVSSHGRLQSF